MKFISFVVDGRPSWGQVDGDVITDFGASLTDCPTMVDAIRKGLGAGLSLPGDAPKLPLSRVALTVPIPNPPKILCVGRNYVDHVAEGSNKELPKHPGLFARTVKSLTPHGGPIMRPKASDNLDFEGELAVIIGKSGRAVPKETALSHVFGYACFNDATLRDFQEKYSALVGKNFPFTGGFGPWVVTADEIPDPNADLSLTTRLNGEVMQHSQTGKMIFDVATIIAFVSVFTELEPGDILLTGTPEGIGRARNPPVWMKPGDTVEVEIDRIGTLRNVITQEA
ncbi:5-carboxymethyl-2-hydroxymuconate Delta-isomerase [Rhizobium sp. CF080]|uniref:fumarylacetoacetate hydrolase family protein n=1 Tax=Rhizobium sp. (strain CF080) TaxID=1144310 RepID=UPI000271787B|nr:fumarylacetoacetate hydrolase family protein [Rhizobium sp. CF080]EUB98151.1 5-carboxymethyl-2-hydroxymuconate Delta-isomerase [Rhizobium sp. CF080]